MYTGALTAKILRKMLKLGKNVTPQDKIIVYPHSVGNKKSYATADTCRNLYKSIKKYC